MSQLLDLASKVNGGGLSAANHAQRVTLKALNKIAGLASKTPDAPEKVSRPIRKVTGPVASVVGSPAELATYSSRTAREWAELQLAFQARVLDAVVGTRLAPKVAAVPTGEGAAGDAPVVLKSTK